MSKRIAQFLFNKLFSDFIESYNDSFGDFTPHLRTHVLKDFRMINSVFEFHFQGSYLMIGDKKLFNSLSPGKHILHISPNNNSFIDGEEYFNIDINGEKQPIDINDVQFIKTHLPSA